MEMDAGGKIVVITVVLVGAVALEALLADAPAAAGGWTT